jgi:hypothetical protein
MVVKKLSKVVSLALSTVILSLLVFPSSASAQTTEYMGYSKNGSQASEKADTISITYNDYTFEIPDYWGDPIEYGNELYFVDKSGSLPLLYMTYASKDYYTEKYNVSAIKFKDYAKILEESLDDFISCVFESSDFHDSTNRFIAGNPAITRTGTCNIDGDDDAFIAQFIDDDNIYVIMVIDYEDSESTIFDDIDELLDSFKAID